MSSPSGSGVEAGKRDNNEEYPLQNLQSVPLEKDAKYDDNRNSTHEKRSRSPDGGPVEETSTPPVQESKRRRPSVPDFLKPHRRVSSFGNKVKALIAREANFYVSLILQIIEI